MKALEREFVRVLEDAGGKVYLVGGIVRDMFLGRESKDLDVLVTGLPMDILLSLLKPLGRVDVVGVSFGVIKFKPFGETEDIDIALPRTEVKSGEGHQGFDVTIDHTLSVEDDLARRDFTMNAIAVDSSGNFIDPFNGRKHIQDKVIVAVSSTSFKDDPLRILRATQFAARFDFKISFATFNKILAAEHLIREISAERIHAELHKLLKGDVDFGLTFLYVFGVAEFIKGETLGKSYPYNKIKSLAQLLFTICSGDIKFHRRRPVLEQTLRLTRDESKELEVLFSVSHLQTRYGMYTCGISWPGIYDTEYFVDEKIVTFLSEFNAGYYPKNLKELSTTSERLMELGVEDLFLGLMYRDIIRAIMEDRLLNVSQQIEDFVVNYLKKV